MQSILRDIEKEHQPIQKADIIILFKVAQFAIAFQHRKVSTSAKIDMPIDDSTASTSSGIADDSFFDGNLCGPIAATVNEAMFSLVICKWREAFECLKENSNLQIISAAGSLMKNMIRMLDLVLKFSPGESKEPQTARMLLYKLFYDQTEQGLTQFLFNLFKSFDSHKQPRSELADLLEIIHVGLRLMENLQSRGTLRVSKKVRSRKKMSKKRTEFNGVREHSNDQTVNEDNGDKAHNPASLADQSKLFPEHSEEPRDNELKESISFTDLEHDLKVDSYHTQGNETSNSPESLASESSDSSNDDQTPATYEADFNASNLFRGFASNSVIYRLCWLLKYYKINLPVTNHHIICMLRRFCDDLEISPILYQLSFLTIFYGILSEQNSSPSKEHASTVHFLTKLVGRMLRLFSTQPLLFVKLLFWKTRQNCLYINAEGLLHDLDKIKKVKRKLEGECNIAKSTKEFYRKSIADSFGEDETDFVIENELNVEGKSLKDAELGNDSRSTKTNLVHMEDTTSNIEGKIDNTRLREGFSHVIQNKKKAKQGRSTILDEKHEIAIRNLYEKYKGIRRCSTLIAKALDADGKISPAQVSRKLRQLGLEPYAGNKVEPTNDAASSKGPNVEKDVLAPESSVYSRKRVRAFSESQELELKNLYERFKNDKKCCQMIAAALDTNGTYTAAQVSRKLRRLGLLISKRSKASEDHAMVGKGQSDEETLYEMRKRQQRKEKRPAVPTIDLKREMLNDSEEPLNEFAATSDELGFKTGVSSSIKADLELQDEEDAVAAAEEGHNKPEDLEDSEDELERPISQIQSGGSRRTHRVYIDFDDED